MILALRQARARVDIVVEEAAGTGPGKDLQVAHTEVVGVRIGPSAEVEDHKDLDLSVVWEALDLRDRRFEVRGQDLLGVEEDRKDMMAACVGLGLAIRSSGCLWLGLTRLRGCEGFGRWEVCYYYWRRSDC